MQEEQEKDYYFMDATLIGKLISDSNNIYICSKT